MQARALALYAGFLQADPTTYLPTLCVVHCFVVAGYVQRSAGCKCLSGEPSFVLCVLQKLANPTARVAVVVCYACVFVACVISAATAPALPCVWCVYVCILSLIIACHMCAPCANMQRASVVLRHTRLRSRSFCIALATPRYSLLPAL